MLKAESTLLIYLSRLLNCFILKSAFYNSSRAGMYNTFIVLILYIRFLTPLFLLG